MSDYEERREERRERYLELAEKARGEAAARVGSRNVETLRAMNGQPILVGHHSEKRHRALIRRADNDMRASVEATRKAEHYERKAAGVGKAGISSDDPEAISKLREKLAGMEASREKMKRVNSAWRKVGKPGPEYSEAWVKIAEAAGITAEVAGKIRVDMARDFIARAPFTYQLTNLGANIKRVEARISALEKKAAIPAAALVEGNGWRVEEAPEDNRIRFYFDRRLSREACAVMRWNGWRWSPTVGAWQRHLNNAGRYSAERVARELRKVERDE